MDAQIEEKVLKECGFVPSARKAHATEYKFKNVIVYTVDTNQLNLVINPEDFVYMKEYACKKLYNSNFISFPSEINKGEIPTHYGYKVVFDNSLSMKDFLINGKKQLVSIML